MVLDVDDASAMTMIRMGVAEPAVEPIETATVEPYRSHTALAAPPDDDDEEGL